jgi:hypothetical protein
MAGNGSVRCVWPFAAWREPARASTWAAALRHHCDDDTDGEDEIFPERNTEEAADREENHSDRHREDADQTAQVRDLLAQRRDLFATGLCFPLRQSEIDAAQTG